MSRARPDLWGSHPGNRWLYPDTTKRKNKNGSVAEYYQLAHNEHHLVSG